MYPPRHFTSEALDEALSIAAEVRFATIVPLRGELCEAIFAPLITVRDGEGPAMLGHLLRTNPLRGLIADGPLPVRIVFHAADGYVSPSVYAEKAISGKVVPTWNYVAAQFEGLLETVAEEELMGLLERQVFEFESAVGSDWRLHDAPSEYLEMMARAIFGIRFTPRSWRVHKKLSQNRPQEMAVIRDWLAAQQGGQRSIAAWLESEAAPSGED